MEDRHRTFRNPRTLKRMLNLKQQGWNFSDLAKKYHCHHSSVMYHVKKSNLPIIINYKRTFKDPRIVREMIDLFLGGQTLGNLARKYNCDHSTLNYHIEKYYSQKPKIEKKVNYGEPLKMKTKFEPVDEMGDPVRETKNYAFYEEKDKQERKQMNDLYIKKRLEEENRKSKFCENESEILIRIIL